MLSCSLADVKCSEFQRRMKGELILSLNQYKIDTDSKALRMTPLASLNGTDKRLLKYAEALMGTFLQVLIKWF